MAIRYAMGRRTIASSTLPADLVGAYWTRWTVDQKQAIVSDLQREFEFFGDEAFGDRDIDKPHWMKFWRALSSESHFLVECVDGATHLVFEFNERIYPLDAYIKAPNMEIFLPKENIKRVISNTESKE